jgi:hypothetical protein
VAGSFLEYWTPRYWNFESSLTASSKPFARASVVEMPAFTDMTITCPPFGLSCLMASKAALPT